MSCACEEANPEVSQEYYLLRRMIDSPENFIEVTALGEDLAMEVIKMWMQTACRDLCKNLVFNHQSVLTFSICSKFPVASRVKCNWQVLPANLCEIGVC